MVSGKAILGAITGGIVGYFGTGILSFFLFDGVGKEIMIFGVIVAFISAPIGYMVSSPSKQNKSSYGQEELENIEIPDYKKVELQKIARRSTGSTFLVTLVIPSLGYYLVGREGLAAVCFFTGHFGLLAHIFGPFHTRKIVKEAQQQLERAG